VSLSVPSDEDAVEDNDAAAEPFKHLLRAIFSTRLACERISTTPWLGLQRREHW